MVALPAIAFWIPDTRESPIICLKKRSTSVASTTLPFSSKTFIAWASTTSPPWKPIHSRQFSSFLRHCGRLLPALDRNFVTRLGRGLGLDEAVDRRPVLSTPFIRIFAMRDIGVMLNYPYQLRKVVGLKMRGARFHARIVFTSVGVHRCHGCPQGFDPSRFVGEIISDTSLNRTVTSLTCSSKTLPPHVKLGPPTSSHPVSGRSPHSAGSSPRVGYSA